MHHGNGIQIAQLPLGPTQRLADHRRDGHHMLSRGHLGKDAAIVAVQLDLRRHHARDDVTPVAHHGRAGLVTRGLDGQDVRHG